MEVNVEEDLNIKLNKYMEEDKEDLPLSKKYISVFVGCNDYEDEVKINTIKNIYEEEIEFLKFIDWEDYYGFKNVDLRSPSYSYYLIITDDEKYNTKYRDIYSFDEFEKICNDRIGNEVFEYFKLIWNNEFKSANKFWKSDSYESDEGQTFYTEPYAKWIKGK